MLNCLNCVCRDLSFPARDLSLFNDNFLLGNFSEIFLPCGTWHCFLQHWWSHLRSLDSSSVDWMIWSDWTQTQSISNNNHLWCRPSTKQFYINNYPALAYSVIFTSVQFEKPFIWRHIPSKLVKFLCLIIYFYRNFYIFFRLILHGNWIFHKILCRGTWRQKEECAQSFKIYDEIYFILLILFILYLFYTGYILLFYLPRAE